MLARKEETVVADEDEQLASRVARIESDVAHIDRNLATMQIDYRELRKEMGEGFKAVNARVDVFHTGLDGKIESVRTQLEGKIESVRTQLEGRIESVHTQLDGKIESVCTQLDGKIESVRTQLDGKIESVRTQGTKHFLWLLSTMIALALAVGGALLKGLLAR